MDWIALAWGVVLIGWVIVGLRYFKYYRNIHKDV